MIGVKGYRGLAAVAALAASTTVGAQEKPTLTPEDYGQWESHTSLALSPDGTWLVYGIRRVNEKDELRIRALDEDAARVVPFGSGATFDRTGRWLAYRIGLSPEERDEEGAREGMGLFDLRARSDTAFSDVSSFEFSEDGEYLAILRDRAEGEGGGDLLVRELATGSEVPLGNVASHAWSPDGHLLAMTLETASGSGNGVQLYDAGAGTLRILDRGETAYRVMTWREDDDDLAVLRAVKDDGFEDETHHVLLRSTRARRGRPTAGLSSFASGLGTAFSSRPIPPRRLRPIPPRPRTRWRSRTCRFGTRTTHGSSPCSVHRSAVT
jgi:hypothetical protein